MNVWCSLTETSVKQMGQDDILLEISATEHGIPTLVAIDYTCYSLDLWGTRNARKLALLNIRDLVLLQETVGAHEE